MGSSIRAAAAAAATVKPQQSSTADRSGRPKPAAGAAAAAAHAAHFTGSSRGVRLMPNIESWRSLQGGMQLARAQQAGRNCGLINGSCIVGMPRAASETSGSAGILCLGRYAVAPHSQPTAGLPQLAGHRAHAQRDAAHRVPRAQHASASGHRGCTGREPPCCGVVCGGARGKKATEGRIWFTGTCVHRLATTQAMQAPTCSPPVVPPPAELVPVAACIAVAV